MIFERKPFVPPPQVPPTLQTHPSSHRTARLHPPDDDAPLTLHPARPASLLAPALFVGGDRFDLFGLSSLCPPFAKTPYSHAMIVHRTIVKFCESDAPKITLDHVWITPSPYKTGSRSRRPVKPPTEPWVLARALEVWERMHPSLENARNLGDGRGGGGDGGVPISKTFDSVLKVFQLSQPDLSPKYDLIMLDEAQDINGCQADIISRQTKCRVIVVGDPHQARERHSTPHQ